MDIRTSAARRNPARTPFEIVERKGVGHPDTLSDHLAEALSRAYSRYTLARFGTILRHQFDKTTLMCGRSRVEFGGGEMLEPVRVLVNGRACERLGSEPIPVRDILHEAVRSFFRERLPSLDSDRDLAIIYEVRHGLHTTTGGIFGDDKANAASIHYRFYPRSLADLPEARFPMSNDTSLGCSFAPHSPLEKLVLAIEDQLLEEAGRALHPWLGSDIKTMAARSGDHLSIVVAAPILASAAQTADAYFHFRGVVEQFVRDLVEATMPDHRLEQLIVNSGDSLRERKLYLNLTGSSIESGDEGQVGRGNRMGGVIAPLRPFTMEGICGKNPLYHVGKVYSVAAFEIARRLALRGIESDIYLLNRMGEPLDRPFAAYVDLDNDGDVDSSVIEDEVTTVLSGLRSITEGILDEHYRLS